jgi:virulence-associated protein VapD
MIKISLDEAYVFDMLSILDLKKDKSIDTKDHQKHVKNYNRLHQDILDHIGNKKLKQIIGSIHYKNLMQTNIKVFELVEKAKEDKGIASAIDNTNYKRFILKNKLQKKFFKNSLKEVKIGYDKV